MPDPTATAVFERDGDLFVPTELARGPWDPNALHGGPSAALLAHAIESVPSEQPVVLARLTVELVRPVPMAPLRVETRPTTTGRKVQRVEASLIAGDREVARASGVRLRELPAGVLDPSVTPTAAPPPRPDPLPQPPDIEEWPTNFGRAMEWRGRPPRSGEYGAQAVWFRLTVPMVAGEATTPWMRIAGAADFGNGISTDLSWETHTFINPDLTVYVHRLPVGEWICLDARTWAQPNGVALAVSTLYDDTGLIGQASQSVLLEPRPPSE